MGNTREIIENQLPEPWKTLALANIERLNEPSEDVGDLEDAIGIMCLWAKTLEGSDFWEDVHYAITGDEIDMDAMPDPPTYIDKPTKKKALGFSNKYELNGKPFDPDAHEELIAETVAKRDALNEELKELRRVKRAFERWSK